MRKLHADSWGHSQSIPQAKPISTYQPFHAGRRTSMSFQAPDSLVEQIARHIGQQIIAGELKAGDRIQELRIAGELDVSRGSVREAFLLLERRYLIDIIPRKGAVVSAMSAKQVENIYEMNVLLLSYLARKAVSVWQDSDLPPFLSLVQAMEQQVQDNEPLQFFESTFQFLHLAYRFVDNEYLEDMLDDLQPAIRRTYYMAIHVDQAEMRASLQFFQALVDRLMARDGEGAAAALAQFGRHQCAIVLNHLTSH